MQRPIVPPKFRAQTNGIDVSGFQGRIDWDEVKASGLVKYAYIRCCGVSHHVDGPHGWTDSEFDHNWREAKRVGIVRGPYVALHAENGDGADHFAILSSSIRAAGGWSATDMPPAIDIEKPDSPSPAMAGQIVAVAVELAHLIEVKMGRKPIIYSGAFWEQWIARQRPELAGALKRYPIWTPDYRENVGPGVPEGWSQWLIWQHTSRGRVPGIGTNVDMNRFDGGRFAFGFWRARSVWPIAVAGGALVLLLAGGVCLAVAGDA